MLQALKHHTKVKQGGIIELKDIPLKTGTNLEVILIENDDINISDLLRASETSLEFWNNTIDDNVWNDTQK